MVYTVGVNEPGYKAKRNNTQPNPSLPPISLTLTHSLSHPLTHTHTHTLSLTHLLSFPPPSPLSLLKTHAHMRAHLQSGLISDCLLALAAAAAAAAVWTHSPAKQTWIPSGSLASRCSRAKRRGTQACRAGHRCETAMCRGGCCCQNHHSSWCSCCWSHHCPWWLRGSGCHELGRVGTRCSHRQQSHWRATQRLSAHHPPRRGHGIGQMPASLLWRKRRCCRHRQRCDHHHDHHDHHYHVGKSTTGGRRMMLGSRPVESLRQWTWRGLSWSRACGLVDCVVPGAALPSLS